LEKSDLAAARDVSLILAVYLYFAGWTYQFYFLGHFGVALTALEIPVYYFFLYAFSAITFYTSLIVLLSILVILCVMTLTMLSLPGRIKQRLHTSSKFIFILTLILLFPILFYAAKEAGEIRAKELRTGRYSSKSVKFLLKPELAKRYPKELLSANEMGKLKLLVHNKDFYFIFWQIENESVGSKAVPYGYTYHVPETDSDVVMIEMRGFSKTEVGQ
jgi:hypothetical protein